MKQRILGGTGISVSEFALGTMMLGAMGNTDHDESVRMIHTALDAGINFVDTADVYSAGESEEIVGRALAGRRDDVVLATKFGLPVGSDPNQRGGSPRWIARAVERSLRRLGTDHIDLYQMHRPDYGTDIDETLAALSDLIHSGKVRAIGCSTFPAELIVEAHWTADRRGHHRFRTEQPRYSILNRTIEGRGAPDGPALRDGCPHLRPAEQWLALRPDRPDQGAPGRGSGGEELRPHRAANRAKLEAVQQLTHLAAEAGLPLTHLATAFVRAHPGGHLGHHRSPHTRAARRSPGRSRCRARRDILDRIDEIVPPGTELNRADNYFAASPAIEDKRLRRR